jgi:hypothetical protein
MFREYRLIQEGTDQSCLIGHPVALQNKPVSPNEHSVQAESTFEKFAFNRQAHQDP